MVTLQMGTGMYNVLVAFILALFFALGIRSLLLIILGAIQASSTFYFIFWSESHSCS